jgi:putative ABC transport system permease protein
LRLDTTLLQSYDSEGNFLNIIIYFTVLTLFIALLGLFSFSLFVTEKFTREIGIRKAFGASSADIFRLLISKFALLVIFSNIFAWPVAEIIVHNWLDGFAYKVNLSWLTFILASAVALAIAMITVSIQTFRTASKRPVDILKYE